MSANYHNNIQNTSQKKQKIPNQPAKTSLVNKKAYHNYFIEESIEVGIVLQGSEVKAIRAGKVNIKDCFVKIINNEAFVFGMHITHLDTTHSFYRPNEKRDKKLLLHKKQINKLFQKVSQDGNSIVVTRLYFNRKNIVKL